MYIVRYVHTGTCVTLTAYIKGPPGTLYCIKVLLAGIYLSARPLTRESYDRYTLLRKPSQLLGNGNTNYINHAQIRYVWEITHSPSGTTHPWVSCSIPHTYLLGMMYVIHTPYSYSSVLHTKKLKTLFFLAFVTFLGHGAC